MAKLCRASSSDNMEFLQWLYKSFKCKPSSRARFTHQLPSLLPQL